MKITLKDKKYTFLIAYQKEQQYMAAINELAVKIFGLSFKEWF